MGLTQGVVPVRAVRFGRVWAVGPAAIVFNVPEPIFSQLSPSSSTHTGGASDVRGARARDGTPCVRAAGLASHVPPGISDLLALTRKSRADSPLARLALVAWRWDRLADFGT